MNNFHDHLLAAPIGFTEAAGNFQLQNASGQGYAGDPVLTEADDGANTLCAPCGASRVARTGTTSTTRT